MKLKFTEQSTIEYWDHLYDQNDFNAYCYKQRMNTVLSWLDGINFSKKPMLLDAGCGAGRFTREAALRGYNVFGMDRSYGMTINARNLFTGDDQIGAGFLQGDLEALPLQDSSFDVIICLGVVAYLKTEKKALESLARALKPDGILAISIVNKSRLASRLDFPLLIIELTKKIFYKISALLRKNLEVNGKPVVKPYFIPKFKQSLEQTGFKVMEYRTVPWKLLTFCDKEVFPHNIAVKITMFIERFSDIPFIGSFGGMCIFMAQKKPISNTVDIVDLATSKLK